MKQALYRSFCFSAKEGVLTLSSISVAFTLCIIFSVFLANRNVNVFASGSNNRWTSSISHMYYYRCTLSFTQSKSLG